MKRPTTMRSTDSNISKGITMRNNKIYGAVLGLLILASICFAQADKEPTPSKQMVMPINLISLPLH